MRSVLRRPALLLSAVVTILVPSALVALAVHEDSVGAALSQGSQQETRLPGFAPGGAETRTGGLRLLSGAAAAGRALSYQGVESIGSTTLAGPSTVTATLWHQAGGLTVTQVAGDQPEAAHGGDMGGVLGVTPTMVWLLGKHYKTVYRGTGSMAGRPVLVVDALRTDGSTAARFWLDKATLLPLGRDVYGGPPRVVSEDRFTRVRLGPARTPKVNTGPGDAGWTAAPSPARLFSVPNGAGRLLPRNLPGNLSLYEASSATTPAGKVTDFGFSDGLSVLSLFVEHGSLPRRMPVGWTRERVRGHVVYVAQHEVAMSGRGFVYTIVTDAPPKTVDAVVGALPATGEQGILGRLGRGLGRLAKVLDPFR